MEEFKTLEIDIPNKNFRLNGKDLSNCTELDISFKNGIWHIRIVNEFTQKNS